MNKAKANKLDPFSERMEQWEREGKTLDEIRAGLLADGCSASVSSISEYLSRKRREALEQNVLAQIANGGRMNAQLDAAYAENPEPAIERLIAISKTLVMTLQVEGGADLRKLALANAMQQTVLGYLSARTKAELKEKELSLGERRVRVLESKIESAAKKLEAARAVGGISQETFEQVTKELNLL